MRRLVLAMCVIAIAAVSAGATADRALAGSLCVGSGVHCFATIQAAVDAANDGGIIHIGPGTFAGGITIDKNLKLIGAGAGTTIISGGGPVVTIGQFGAPSEPTVSIRAVTITGGLNTSTPVPFFAAGGGIAVPAAADGGNGATVAINDTVIAGNRAAPASTSPSPSGVLCGGGTFCPYAQGEGGGIFNAGTMTLHHVVISDNEAGSGVTSDAVGGGVANQPGATLVLHDCSVSGNLARAPAPNGRFAEGGGIFMRRNGTLTLEGSSVSGNRAELVVAQDVLSDGTLAQSGGVRIGPGVRAAIRGSLISGNAVSSVSLLGNSLAFSGGIDDDGSLVLRDSTVSDNRVESATTAPAENADSGPAGLEIDGTAVVSDTRFTGNSVTATALGGRAFATGGAIQTVAEDLVRVSGSLVEDNRVTAMAATGFARAVGAGITNDGLLELREAHVRDNRGSATGPAGLAQGGGIWSSILDPGFPESGALTLIESSVTHNALSGSPGITIQGGGLFTTFPVTLKDSFIAGNTPDQCYGC